MGGTYEVAAEEDEDVGAGEDGQQAVVYGGVCDDLVFEPVFASCALSPDGCVADGDGHSYQNMLARFPIARRRRSNLWLPSIRQ